VSTPTNGFPTVSSIALSDTFLVNASGASSKISGTNVILSLDLAIFTEGGILLPETPSDNDPSAPSSGAIIYSKIVGGKNGLFVRFPTGNVQQIAIES